MHLRLPKRLHGWRELLGEVGIIVVGVLIALGAEQVVENGLRRRCEGQRLRSGTGPLTSLSKVWQPRTAIIVAMAKANDISTSNSFGFEGRATRTARTIKVARAARDRP